MITITVSGNYLKYRKLEHDGPACRAAPSLGAAIAFAVYAKRPPVKILGPIF